MVSHDLRCDLTQRPQVSQQLAMYRTPTRHEQTLVRRVTHQGVPERIAALRRHTTRKDDFGFHQLVQGAVQLFWRQR